MSNVHDGDKGRPVSALGARHRRRSADFPGWGDPDYARYLLPIPAGLKGVVTRVESHGSNPWTRYSVTFADNSAASGLCAGVDFRFTGSEES